VVECFLGASKPCSERIRRMDCFSKSKRSAVMRRIKSTNTEPELIVRSILHAIGLRFRLHRKNLPGTPDIVLAKHKLIINVNGCFWHGHTCQKSRIPHSNQTYWSNKIAKNCNRDRMNARTLRRAGWRVITVWECWTKRYEFLERRLRRMLVRKGLEIST
jgi:DNA mismatch endonuclease (patch repair protein)